LYGCSECSYQSSHAKLDLFAVVVSFHSGGVGGKISELLAIVVAERKLLLDDSAEIVLVECQQFIEVVGGDFV
jgi:hypothetical protein